jgi:predicted DNA binding protein
MRAVELHVLPEGGAFPGIDTALATLSAVRRESVLDFEWHNDGSYTLLYRLSGDREALEELLSDHEQVVRYDIAGEDPIHVFTNVSEREGLSRLLSIADDHTLLLEPPFEFTDDGVAVTVAGAESTLQSAFATTVTEDVDIEIEAAGEYEPETPAGIEQMTDRQYEALAVAHELGYYETPREVSFEEVAAELDCAPSTANELLRRAESALVSSVLARS